MDIEQLRRQAKELVRAVRAGDRDALARLAGLPPRLASAQLVLAREHGHTSWPALVRSATLDYHAIVEELGTERWHAAWERLLTAGGAATEAVRAGLAHTDQKVRRRCCGILDHHLDEASLPALVACLDDRDGRVRASALHALACEDCKEGQCRLPEEDVVPLVLRFLREDRSRRVRTGAAQILGAYSPLRADVRQALEHARDHDPHPVVREVAGWHTPGAHNYRKRAAQLGLPG
jgi:hypothetical protein